MAFSAGVAGDEGFARSIGAATLAPQLDLLMSAGAEANIWQDRARGCPAPAAPCRPADHEIWFSSTGAQSITRRAFDETIAVLARLTREPSVAPLSLSAWFDGLHAEIARGFAGCDAAVLLASNVAEAREHARAIAGLLLSRRYVEIATTPAESTAFAPGASDGALTLVVELRDRHGAPREQAGIDANARDLAEAALESGAAVLFHCLDTSKTGLSGISRGAARAVELAAPGRAIALVDASEGRAYANELRADLAQGRMVIVSGSQFTGGPPWSAALLLPDAIAGELAARGAPAGFWPARARLDASDSLRETLARPDALAADIGLGLRWWAALVEQRAHARIDADLRRRALETFGRKVRAMAARHPFLEVEAPLLDGGDDPMRDSIVSLIPLARGGTPALDQAVALRDALARPCAWLDGDAICHVGHVAPAGPRAAVTVSASAPLVNGVAARVAAGLSFERAMTPVLRDVETLFRKWEAVAG